MNGVHSGGIVGIPSKVPAGWVLRQGYLLGPAANLSRANLVGVNLRGLNLQSATLSHANLSRANLSSANLLWAQLDGALAPGAVWTRALCPDGKRAESHRGTCIGVTGFHGS